MLKWILTETRLFRSGDQKLNGRGLLGFLEALTHWNEVYLDEHPETPPLYQAGVRYALPEPFMRDMPSPEKIERALVRVGLPREMAKSLADVLTTGEHFRDFPSLLENGQGDCLPVETLVDTTHGLRPLGNIRVGDELVYGPGRTRVERVWPRSMKPIVTLFLSNGRRLASSPEHRHFTVKYGPKRADSIVVGEALCSDTNGGVVVNGIETGPERECVDIAVSGLHRFWLPESRVVTHNCDNLAAARAAELRSVGIDASTFLTATPRDDGGITFHAIVRWPDGTPEDPSRILGMGGSTPRALWLRNLELKWLAERQENAAVAIIGAAQAGGIHPMARPKLQRLMALLQPPPRPVMEATSIHDRSAFDRQFTKARGASWWRRAA